MFCSKCGKEIENAATFCPQCGSKVGEGVAPSEARTADVISAFGAQNILAMLGGALLIIAFFMPWIDIEIIRVSGFKLFKTATGVELVLAILAWVIPIAGAVVAFFAFSKSSKMNIAAQIASVLTAVVLVWFLYSYGVEIKGMTGKFSNVFRGIGLGIFLMVASVICLNIAARIAANKKKKGEK